MTYRLSLKAQFEIKGVKRGPYVMVQKYINLVKNKPINLDPKGLSKIELKKFFLCKITNSAQIEAQTRQTDQSEIGRAHV